MNNRGFTQPFYGSVKLFLAKRAGFTLVEVMIVTVILTMLAGILLGTIMEVNSIFRITDITATLQSNARSALNKMALDLRKTSRVKISIAEDSPSEGIDKITYVLPKVDAYGEPILTAGGDIDWDTVNSITIKLDPAKGQLLKDSTVLANDVKKINFYNASFSDELKITLELEQTDYKERVYSLTFTSYVYMRN